MYKTPTSISHNTFEKVKGTTTQLVRAKENVISGASIKRIALALPGIVLPSLIV